VTDRDDGDADDPQLQSLRAVWLAMPDEEPPQRGLAELMAAARVKADAMATPSLWQRISALLRRPPVLALATVLVLIGGAVFIGQRKDSMQAEHVAMESPPAATPSTAAAVPSAGSAAAASAPEAVEPMIPEMVPEPAFEAEPPSVAQPVVTRRPPAKKERVDTGVAVPQGERKRIVETSDDKNLEEGTRGRDLAKPAEASVSAASDSFAVPAAKLEHEAPGGGAVPPAEAPQTTSTQSSSRGGTAPRATKQAPQPSRVVQDLAQAKAAAARGDCATARAAMKRVASDDATAYRKALASDAALNSCMAVAK
jgi:hypothetical protein